MKAYLALLLMNLSIAAMASESNSNIIDYKSCPTGKDLAPYNHFHPVSAVFVTTDFAKQLSKVILKHEPNIKIHEIKTEGSAFIQDGFEIAYDPIRKSSVVLEPNHADGTVAPIVSKLLGLPLENYGFDTYSDEATGNFEGLPGGLTLMGRPLKDNGPTFQELDKILYIATDGTVAGHVDELFTVIPHLIKREASLCPFTVFYSSGQAAIDVLKLLPKNAKLQVELAKEHGHYLSGYKINNCFDDFSYPVLSRNGVTVEQASACTPFINNLSQAEKFRKVQMALLNSFLENKLGCQVEFIGLPYFLAKEASLSPNPVNALVLNKTVLIGKQANTFLEGHIASKIEAATGYMVDYVDDHQFHYHGGNVHCLTNTLRTCEKRK